MANKMLIDSSHPEETRVVVVRGNRVEEFDFESEHKKQLKGNIYLAKVTRVEPSLQAAFIEYGGGRHGFLAFSEIHPDYYQIPKADREALLAEEMARGQADEEDEEEEREVKRKSRSKAARREDKSDESVSEDAEAEGGLRDDLNDSDDADSERRNEDVDAAAKTEADDSVNAESRADEDLPDDDDREIAVNVDEDDDSDDDSDDEDSSEDDDSGDRENDEEEASSDGEGRRSKRSARRKRGRRSSNRGRGRHDSDDKEVDSDNDGDDDNGDEVDEIGSEDALEEVPVRQARPRKNYKIQEVIKRRQILLVQVVKEERGNKGAALTTYLSLAGRYSVLMPNTARGGGISRKITNQADRKRLRDVVKELDVPRGMGIILRTAGANRTKAEVKRDYEYLMRLWESVRTLTLQSIAPSLVYEEGSLIKRSIRDLFNKDIDQILVSGEAGYREAKDFMRMLMPSQAKAVQPYRDATPIFTRQGIEAQLDKMLQPHVTLKSGGYIIINQTEALVAIDVNSGRSTREMSIENTAYQTNLEAAEEIARQLRLRDLAGLIVVDFIDMDEKRNNRNVEKKMKDCLKNDRARIQVGKISHFGLMEMSRQRIRASVLESTMRPCPVCEGAGMVRATSSLALHAIRHIEDYLQKNKGRDLIVKVPTETALFILNEKRHHIDELEQNHDLRIFIEADPSVGHNDLSIEQGGVASRPITRNFVSPISVAAEDAVDEDEDADVEISEEETGTSEARDDSESSDDNNEGRSKGRGRRRRRRRGGSDGDDNENGGNEQQASDSSNASSDDVDNSDDESQDSDGSSGRRRRRRGRRGGRRHRDGNDKQAEGQIESDQDNDQQSDDADGAEEENSQGRRRRQSNWGSKSDEDTKSTEKSDAEPDGSATEPSDTGVGAMPAIDPAAPSTADERFDDPVATLIGEAAEAGSAEKAATEESSESTPASDRDEDNTPSNDNERSTAGAADESGEKKDEKPKQAALTEPVVTSGEDNGGPKQEETKPRRTGWWSRGFF
ncbi:Ribonuclease E and G [Fulvimarina pelagi HTCC2506]|uniref:Ribonuclease E n=1 Tax=Fulvimarina pelagi HTCC2506 TaxID=314231 RepID=Q0G6Z6_9HYPH|nr:Rne/Rng family ribonuclease [Fulvimarina pelagi]EAU42568.1 Ribonuclease E and G [Fulvimarina pelagi HTCC2506]